MAAGDDHRAPIARPDVCQREKDIHLAAAKLIVDETVLVAHHSILVPGMDGEKACGPADGCEAFVDIVKIGEECPEIIGLKCPLFRDIHVQWDLLSFLEHLLFFLRLRPSE